MARIGVTGGAALGPAEGTIRGEAEVTARFSPDQPAGWALYFWIAAALFILWMAAGMRRGGG